jgi:Uma2 family endonuclease
MGARAAYDPSMMFDPAEIAPAQLRPITRAEYERMVELGMFEDERIELLYGALVTMSPHGAPHDSTIDRLTRLMFRLLADRATIRVQGAFAASDYSEPEPDLAVLPPRDYDRAHPTEAWLIIEVAESSLKKDRGPKARTYAAARVPEYWVVNLVAGVIEVHTAPVDGEYTRVESRGRGASITLAHFPDVILQVDDVLPR